MTLRRRILQTSESGHRDASYITVNQESRKRVSSLSP
jgi:hypothetical protein